MIYVAGADLFRYKNRVHAAAPLRVRAENEKSMRDLHFYAVFGEFPDFLAQNIHHPVQ
jgi:hypothetical protein